MISYSAGLTLDDFQMLVFQVTQNDLFVRANDRVCCCKLCI